MTQIGLEFYVFLPQMRMTIDDLVQRARTAEAAGFTGITGMDHLAPPLAQQTPMYEAMVTNTWIAARTDHVRVGSLVLCDSFRHPAVLAREVVSLDHASGGRFDLGIGWGSVPDEIATFGVGSTDPAVRVARLKETLEIIQALWSGEMVDYEGKYFSLKGAVQAPTPLGHIPIVVGGAGRRTMELVAKYADWWNLHIAILDRLEEKRESAGDARISVQIQIGYVPSEVARAEVTEVTRRRFGDGPVIGTAPELREYFLGLADRGVERVYAWFCDFAQPSTLEAFGGEIISQFR